MQERRDAAAAAAGAGGGGGFDAVVMHRGPCRGRHGGDEIGSEFSAVLDNTNQPTPSPARRLPSLALAAASLVVPRSGGGGDFASAGSEHERRQGGSDGTARGGGNLFGCYCWRGEGDLPTGWVHCDGTKPARANAGRGKRSRLGIGWRNGGTDHRHNRFLQAGIGSVRR